MSRVAYVPDRGAALLSIYDSALPQVYGYLLRRCSDRELAEDLTSETFLAAARDIPEQPGVGWLIGVARHKLMDHWRTKARDERVLTGVAGTASDAVDPWEAELDALRADEVLRRLGPQHRAVLTLRYLDDLSVAQTAAVLGRTLHATEALLSRARAAFRAGYEGSAGDDC